jgi:hypothetical protein
LQIRTSKSAEQFQAKASGRERPFLGNFLRNRSRHPHYVGRQGTYVAALVRLPLTQMKRSAVDFGSDAPVARRASVEMIFAIEKRLASEFRQERAG